MVERSETVGGGLSIAERDRRLRNTRRLLAEHGLSALVVPPGPRMNPIDGYFTNDVPNSAVVVPLEGDPVAIHRSPGLMGSLVISEERGEQRWIEDWRFAPLADGIVAVLRERGLSAARVGVVAVEKGTPIYPNGWVPFGLWQAVKDALPRVEFVEMWDPFALLWLVKSDEELALFRRAADVAEQACAAMLEIASCGATEADLYAAAQNAILRAGAEAPFLILHTGQDNLSWGAPGWLHRGAAPRVLEAGDVVLSELFPTVGGIEAQAQMCIGIDRVDDDFLRAAELARAGYEAGVAALRPGASFGDVADAAAAPVLEAGAWHLTPQVHSLTPLALIGPVMQGPVDASLSPHMPAGGYPSRTSGLISSETEVVPGMTFQIETNAVIGRKRINIGGNAIVTSDGCEPLNSLPTRFHCVGGP